MFLYCSSFFFFLLSKLCGFRKSPYPSCAVSKHLKCSACRIYTVYGELSKSCTYITALDWMSCFPRVSPTGWKSELLRNTCFLKIMIFFFPSLINCFVPLRSYARDAKLHQSISVQLKVDHVLLKPGLVLGFTEIPHSLLARIFVSLAYFYSQNCAGSIINFFCCCCSSLDMIRRMFTFVSKMTQKEERFWVFILNFTNTLFGCTYWKLATVLWNKAKLACLLNWLKIAPVLFYPTWTIFLPDNWG